MKKLSAVSALLLAAASASAQQINWDSSPSLKTALEGRAPAAVPMAAAVAAEGPMGLLAEPLGASAMAHLDERSEGLSRSVRLILNNDQDRVGAEVGACVSGGGGDMDDCNYLRFAFPRLKVDRQAKTILLDGEVVARYGGFFGLRLEKGFKLSLRWETRVEDRGFNRDLVDAYAVALERK